MADDDAPGNEGESIKIHVEGKVYDLDDFELGELEWLEEEMGDLSPNTLKTVKAAVRFVTLIKRRDNPSFSLEDARKLKLTVFDDPDEAKKPRPTKPRASTRGKSGATS